MYGEGYPTNPNDTGAPVMAAVPVTPIYPQQMVPYQQGPPGYPQPMPPGYPQQMPPGYAQQIPPGYAQPIVQTAPNTVIIKEQEKKNLVMILQRDVVLAYVLLV